MSLITVVRKKIIEHLWRNYIRDYTHTAKIIKALSGKNIVLDHLAIIDLPGPKTGISVLNQIFSALHYIPQGRDYLENKQNEFMWLAPFEAEHQKAHEVDPQLVIADFNLEDLHPKIANIVLDYANLAEPFPWRLFHNLCGDVYKGNTNSAEKLFSLIINYIQERDWPLPTLKEYLYVKEHNELLAWVLIFGRSVNHFALNIKLLTGYHNLEEFNFFAQSLDIKLNHKNGLIQGDLAKKIAQSSTIGEEMQINLDNHMVDVHGPFMEFVWRASHAESPVHWKDYFTGFVGEQANKVIESVYA